MQLPAWNIRKAKDRQNHGDKRSKKEKELKSRGMVTIPYVKGLSKAFSRILKTYRICTAVRPDSMLSNMLVHPKDKISDEEKPEVVYKTPCKNCEQVYVRETGRPLEAHRKAVDSITGIFTRAEKTRAASICICNKSAITDHVCNGNHAIDWENAKAVDRESDKAGRLIREDIWNRNTDNTNRDEGNYQLSHVWDKLLHTDDQHQKSVLMKASDVKPKHR